MHKFRTFLPDPAFSESGKNRGTEEQISHWMLWAGSTRGGPVRYRGKFRARGVFPLGKTWGFSDRGVARARGTTGAQGEKVHP